MPGHATLCYMVVSGNLNSPLNLFISFGKALMDQGFSSDPFLAKGGERQLPVYQSKSEFAKTTVGEAPGSELAILFIPSFRTHWLEPFRTGRQRN